MSQEYTEDKHIKFRKISSGRRLLEAVLIVIGLCAVFLLVALLSFNPSDPSWSQTCLLYTSDAADDLQPV